MRLTIDTKTTDHVDIDLLFRVFREEFAEYIDLNMRPADAGEGNSATSMEERASYEAEVAKLKEDRHAARMEAAEAKAERDKARGELDTLRDYCERQASEITALKEGAPNVPAAPAAETQDVPAPPPAPAGNTEGNAAPPPPPPAQDGAEDAGAPEVDADGVAWDASLHAANKSKTAKGVWKKKRQTKQKEVKPLENATGGLADDSEEPFLRLARRIRDNGIDSKTVDSVYAAMGKEPRDAVEDPELVKLVELALFGG